MGNRSMVFLLCCLQILFVPYLAGAYDTLDVSLTAIIKESRTLDRDFALPERGERSKMASAVRRLLQSFERDPSRLADVPQLADLGFEVVLLEDGSEQYVVLREREGERRGGGIYIFRPSQAQNSPQKDSRRLTVIQAPHSRYDRYTGSISRLVFQKTQAFGLFLNTAHRYADETDNQSDLAHNDQAHFQVVTQTICDYFNNILVIQFHGYTSEKHKDVDQNFAVILSDGVGYTQDRSVLRPIIQRFTAALGEQAVGVFGRNVYQLGGTTNVQARYINSNSDDTFIHVEMSQKLRRRVYRDSDFRDPFIEVFR